jgi:ABC-2 type transport system permease protein
MSTVTNIGNVARREYLVRVRTRSFVFGTLLLVAGVAVIAFLPLIIRQVDSIAATKIAIAAASTGRADAVIEELDAILNPATEASGAASLNADFQLIPVTDVEAARREVLGGTYTALLVVDRDAAGDLAFTAYSNQPAVSTAAARVRQAANAVAVADRLDRLGLPAEDQAALFAPASWTVRSADPTRTDPLPDSLAAVGQDMLAFGMTLLIFMIILMYGNWIAMSVVEEKSSRVMEVVLNAATPFQLLSGKVLGVGAVALTQYGAVVLAGVAALALQQPVGELVLADPAAGSLPQGLTPAMLLAFGAYGVLGFLLYATLFAAAGSLVSRVEDVSAIVMPMTLIATAGYMVGIYSALGLLDIRATWVGILALVPFTGPFMMLGRIATGVATPLEVALSLGLLAGMILVALWVAARIYAVGVLLYGSRPGPRVVARLLREGM